jgi:uncharacterized protein with NRDE domain
MCLIALAWNAHPRFPLVFAANRDEFHNRPTEPLHEWRDVPGAMGGRDLREGGSWLALTRDGRFAAVTNVREPARMTSARSRGELVRNFVANDHCATVGAEIIRVDGDTYGPFNLLLWDGIELVHVTNRPAPSWTTLRRGIHGLSNGRVDAPWPKVRRLTAALQSWLQKIPDTGEPELPPLFEALGDRTTAPDAELPDTGVGIDLERSLSSPFIAGETYGTRASSVILVDRGGRARFIERTFGPNGVMGGERQFTVKLCPSVR